MSSKVNPVLTRLVIGAAVVAAIGVLVAYRVHVSREARMQLLEFRGSIAKVETKDEIERLVDSRRFGRLQLVKESPEEWIIATPLEFGASNWYLYLECSGHRLAKVKIRLADSSEIHPSDAPEDIVRE